MPVWAIIVIAVVVVLILLVLMFAMPRARETARIKRRERELGQRRERVVSEHRQEADTRTRRAQEAEQRARIAEQEARLEREQARLREEQAALHERGMADHELVADHEREQFAGTSADPGAANRAVEDDGGVGATRQAQDGPTSAYDEGRLAAREPERSEDFEEGRRDQLEGEEKPGLLGRLRGDGS